MKYEPGNSLIWSFIENKVVSIYMWPMWLSQNRCSLNIHRTHVTANNSTNNNFAFFFVSDLKIEYYNNY